MNSWDRIAVPEATGKQQGMKGAPMASYKYSYTGVADPIGVHLLSTTEDKIWRDEYVDISLFHREMMTKGSWGRATRATKCSRSQGWLEHEKTGKLPS